MKAYIDDGTFSLGRVKTFEESRNQYFTHEDLGGNVLSYEVIDLLVLSLNWWLYRFIYYPWLYQPNIIDYDGYVFLNVFQHLLEMIYSFCQMKVYRIKFDYSSLDIEPISQLLSKLSTLFQVAH